jgi:hypothetical protein
MLYIVDQDCDGACHLKNYCFVITYLLEDEQELILGMLDMSQTYLLFLMLHACFTPFASCFVYTLWHFYAFSGTNLLMRCHSASSLFSAVLVFQKSYIGNILRIGRNEERNSYFSRTKDEDRTRARGGPEGSHTLGWRAPSWPHHQGVRPPGPPLDDAPSPI